MWRASFGLRPRWLGPAALALALGACAPPESQRVRGGGPGADPGNRGQIVEMHGVSDVYHRQPCALKGEECLGPPAEFGRPISGRD